LQQSLLDAQLKPLCRTNDAATAGQVCGNNKHSSWQLALLDFVGVLVGVLMVAFCTGMH
jgi:hypothetical protein